MSPSKKVKRAAPRRKTAKKAVAKRQTQDAASEADGSSAQNAPKPEVNAKTVVLRILGVLAVIGITAYVYGIRERVEEFAELGFFGAFLIMLIANATVILPAPGLAVIFAMGGVLSPLGVGLSAGLGGALGEVTGYIAGYSGQAAVENTQTYKRLLPWVQRYGAWVILILSAFPNPLFDAAGIAAGIAKIPIWKFLLACWVGVTIKTLVFAFAGAYSIDWVASLYE